MSFNKYAAFCCAAVIATILIITQSFAQHTSGSRAYYVSSSGDDINPGTKTSAFKTINRVNGIHLIAGDTVCFKSGDVFNGSLIVKGTNGTLNKPVVITSYGSRYAIINANDSVGINIYQGSFIKLQHLALMGSGRKTGNVKNGLAIVNCNKISINDLNISGFQKSGLLIYSSQNIIVKKVFAHDNGSAGITVESQYPKRESSDIKILNCRAENNPGDPTNLTNHSGNGIVVGNCINVLIDHCTATNNGWDMPRIGNGPVGIWAYEAEHVVIQHCLSYNNKTSKGGADGGGFDLDGGVTNSVIQYCFSYNNQGSGYCIFQYWGASPWHDNIIRGNISENDGTVSDSQAGMYVWNSSGNPKQFYNCDIDDNIVYNTKVAALSFSDKSENNGFHFYNNIFVGRDSLIKGKDLLGKCRFLRNDWWSLVSGFNIYGIKDFRTWAINSGQEQIDGRILGANINPRFKNAGKAALTTASQIRSFTGYHFSKESKLIPKM